MTDSSSEFLEDPNFQSLLVECLEKLERGEVLGDELFSQYPEYAEPLAAYIEDQQLLKRIAGEVRNSIGGSSDSEIEPTMASGPRVNGFNSGERIQYVGEYEIINEIARGGMGIVFKAKQHRLKRIVALKMILTGNLADEGDVERFEREAQAAAKLQHPNIVAVHEVGQHEGHHYFTMDYVAGPSLNELLREETLAPKRAAEVVKVVSEAIHAVHEQGTLHRDLKPANILIDSDGAPKITDFGLAKMLVGDEQESRTELTAAGQILGTPSYMSPEQAAGKQSHVGPATDIYALGAVLYACLTGRAPFVADSPVDTLMQVIRAEPASPRLLNPGIPRDLETICLKCLHKEPHKRYGTAQDLADDLGRFFEGRPVLARPVGAISKTVSWCRRNPVVASLLLLVAVSLLGGTAIASYFAVQANNQLQVAVAEKQRADDARADAEDARQVAIVAQHNAEDARDEAAQSAKIARTNEKLAEDSAKEAEKRRKESENARQLEAEQRKRAETEKKRAQWQTYVARLQPMRQAWMEEEFGHLDRLLLESIPQDDEPDFRGWEWYFFQDQVNRASVKIGDHKDFQGHFAYDAVNDRTLAATGNDRWQLWDIKLNRLIDTWQLKDCRAETVHFSPDAKKVAWGTTDGRWRILQIESHRILHDIDADPEGDGPGSDIGDVAWSPTGDRIASASRAGDIKVWDTNSGALLVQLQKSTGKNAALSLDWHPQSGLAAALQFGTVRVWDVDEQKVVWSRQLGTQYPSVVKWNPSGTQLVYSGNGSTVIYDRDGKQIVNLPGVGGLSAATWVDDNRVAYGGSNQAVRIHDTTKPDLTESRKIHSGMIESLCSTSGNKLLSGSRDGAIALIDVNEPVRRATKVHAHQAKAAGLRWKPDGLQIATSGHDGSVIIWDATPLAQVHKLIGHRHRLVHDIVWDQKGSHLVSVDHFGSLRTWDTESGKQLLSQRVPIREFITLDRQPKGDRIAVSSTRIHVIDPRTSESLAQGEVKGVFFGSAFSPDGTKIGAVSNTHVVILDAASGRTHSNRWKGQNSGGTGGAWSPNGKLFAAGGNVIQVFDAISYKLVAKLAGQRSATSDLHFHPNGSRLASVGKDGNLIIWDAATGDMMLKIPVRNDSGLLEVEWSPDGRRIAVTTTGGELWIWGSPQMPKIPHDIDYLEDGVLKSVKTAEEQLAELSQRIDGNPGDFSLLKERIEKLVNMQRWPEALADVERVLEKTPGDSWRPAQGLLLASLLNESGSVKKFANRCLEITSGNNALNVRAQSVLALSFAPDSVDDFGPLLKITKEHANEKSAWHFERPLLLALLRAKHFEELGTKLASYLANEQQSSAPRAIVLLLESLRQHEGNQPEAALEFLHRAESIMNDPEWNEKSHNIEGSVVALLLLREVRETLGVEKDSNVSIDDFNLIDSWTQTVEIKESKIDALFAEFVKEEDKSFSDSNQKPTPEDLPERRKNFERMLTATKGVRGVITLQENGEIRSVPSLGYPPMLPRGMTWREIERDDGRLIIEFQHEKGATSKLVMKVMNPDLMEVLPVTSESVPFQIALLQQAMRTTWKRVKSETGKDGKSVTKWLEQIQDESETVRQEAMNSMIRFGANAVAPLLQVATRTRRPEVGRGIGLALKKIVSDPQGDVGDWLDLLQHESELVRQQAMRALPHLGAKALPALTEAIQTESTEMRRNIIIVLGHVGTMRPTNIPTIDSKLVEILKSDQDEHVRSAAVRTMGMFRTKREGSPHESTEPPEEPPGLPPDEEFNKDDFSSFIAALKNDASKSVRIAAAQAIGESQSPSQAAIVALGDALDGDDDALVRHWAADAIGKIGPAASSELPELIKAVKYDESDSTRHSAVFAIGKIKPPPKDVLPALVNALRNDKGMYVRMRAADVIGQLGAAAKEASPHLCDSMKNDKFDSVRSEAAVALAEIGAEDSISAIIEAMKSDDDPFVREGAARALGQFGLAAEQAVPALKEVIGNDDSQRVKRSASSALKQIAVD